MSAFPYNPVMFIEGHPQPADQSASQADPNNLWATIESAQIWNGLNLLGISTAELKSPHPRYTEEGTHISSVVAREADTRRVHDTERFTDRRNLLSLAAFCMVHAEDPSELFADFSGTVLDIGCGVAQVGNDLASNPDVQGINLDISQKVLEEVDTAQIKITGDGTRLPLSDESVDQSISMFCTSVHANTIESRINGLTEQLRVTKVGGRAFTVPLYADLVRRQYDWIGLRDLTRSNTDPDVTPYLEDYRKTLLREAAIDFVQTEVLRSLIANGYIEMTPILVQTEDAKGRIRDGISAIFDIKKPVNTGATDRIVRLSAARFA